MDEEQLVAALRTQEPRAVAQLVDTLGDRLLRSAFLLCGDQTEAQDLVQETFLKALRAAHLFKGESRVYTWLHGILLNLSRHYHRDRRRMVYDDKLAANPRDPAPENPILESDFNAAASGLTKALRCLPNQLREVLVLRFYEELKIEEIAAELELPAGTVKSRLHHALKQMQRLMPGELNLFGPQGTDVMKKR